MSKVYFMNDRAKSVYDSLVVKMLTVFKAAGLENCIAAGDKVAIKLHMGEYNNTAYLRPVYARALADRIRELGGDPVVMDTTTLPYTEFATRTTALDHYKSIERNGYSTAVVGCPIIIADGYLGIDDVRVDLPEGFVLKEQYVAAGIALVDAMIVLTHFKGHPMGTYGGAIKNIGVGCASKRGKFNLHMGRHEKYGWNARRFYPQLCKGLECEFATVCNNVCPEDAFHVTERGCEWEQEKCTGCLSCLGLTAVCGVCFPPDDFFEVGAAAMADSAKATMKTFAPGKVGLINMAIDLSPWCDCVSFSDRPFAPNLGVFASVDPVSIDMACIDMVTQGQGTPGSVAEEKGVMEPGIRKLTACGSFLGVDEMIQPNTGERIGLGEKEYELIVQPQADEPFRFLTDPRPVGARLKPLFAKKLIFPEGGFKREAEVDMEEVRGSGAGLHGKNDKGKAV